MTSARQVLVGRKRRVIVADVPVPAAGPVEVVIATHFSLISAGTESAARSASGGAAGLARRAISDPALRSKALDRVRSQGVRGTYEQAQARAARATLLGYSAAGRVIDVGEGVTGLSIGQLVAASGSEHAAHAEVISVPHPLVTPIPEGVSTEHAAYTTLAAIALHGHRLARLTLGESVAVVGLGLVGQLAAQISAAAGCVVLGTDLSSWRCRRAQACVPDGTFTTELGDLATVVRDRAHGGGVDAVLIAAGGHDTALATRCLGLLRDRGRVVVIGAVPLSLDRDLVYRKELEITVSRSYGPGRYDRAYEERGIDYPIGYVRWTEGRNFAAVLDLMARGRLDVGSLTTAVVPIDEAPRAYELAGQTDGHLGVLLSYPHSRGDAPDRRVPAAAPASPVRRGTKRDGSVRLAVVGPGAFALSVLSPVIRRLEGVEVGMVVARNPAHAQAALRPFRAGRATADTAAAFADPDTDAVIVATRHDTHAQLAADALAAGKDVFMEKPMGLTVGECERVCRAVAESGRLLAVDFNRRFSPLAAALKAQLRPFPTGVTAIYRVNAGMLPGGHWLLDPASGGGRVLGEAVHFLDFLCWLFDGDPVEVTADPAAVADPGDEVVCTLGFGRGRSGTLVYTTRGSTRSSKERVEVFAGGHTWVLDDYRTLERDGRAVIRGRQRKGHAEALANFVDAVRGRAELGVTALDGLRATRLALEVQGRPPVESADGSSLADGDPDPRNASRIAQARPK